jgi:hypothetical protein
MIRPPAVATQRSPGHTDQREIIDMQTQSGTEQAEP